MMNATSESQSGTSRAQQLHYGGSTEKTTGTLDAEMVLRAILASTTSSKSPAIMYHPSPNVRNQKTNWQRMKGDTPSLQHQPSTNSEGITNAKESEAMPLGMHATSEREDNPWH